MADYKVELIITNESNGKSISSESTVGEERAVEIAKNFNDAIGLLNPPTLDEIR